MAGVSVFSLLAAFAAGWRLAPPTSPDQAGYRFTPFACEPGGHFVAAWSPNSKAVAYMARLQLFVRYLESPVPIQVTHTPEIPWPFAWTPDGQRILFYADRHPEGIWSVAAAGGEPEPVLPLPGHRRNWPAVNWSAAASPDLRAIAVLHYEDGYTSVWISSPPGSALKRYIPDPFALPGVAGNVPSLRFSPDGKRLLLFLTAKDGQEGWLLPYPPDPARAPYRILRTLPVGEETPQADWMPDSRHVVVASEGPDSLSHLWIADTVTGEYHALASGTLSYWSPRVSPNGEKLLFRDDQHDFDIASVDLETAKAQRLIATDRSEQTPAWAARKPVLTYVTDRNGPLQIWMRDGEVDRPIVTASDFPPGTTHNLWGPALSPDALRVIYTRFDTTGPSTLWVSSTSGGTPSRVTNGSSDGEFPGSWSSDGQWFAYLAVSKGEESLSLMKVRTGGQAVPMVVKSNVSGEFVPCWSPDGNWISAGNELVSSDGRQTRPLSDRRSYQYMFSADGRRVYGIRREDERLLLFFIDLATGSEKVVGDLGKDFQPTGWLSPGIRFSLAPDGKSFVYAIDRWRSNFWLLEGFAPPSGLLTRLHLRPETVKPSPR